MSEINKILIAGYPKSGNTWVTRLTAEVIGCPVAGFWKSNHNEIAIEGGDRLSNFSCFKSHHIMNQLLELDEFPDKIIYVVRDPRDILLSGEKYFFNEKLLIKFREKVRIIRLFFKMLDILYIPLIGKKKMRQKMKDALLNGNSNVHYWCSNSWASHLESYNSDNVLVLKYEDLIDDTFYEVKKILNYLNVERSDEMIKASIEKQSFENKKNIYYNSGDKRNFQFMRSGKKEQWRNELSGKSLRDFEKFNYLFQKYNYPIK